MPTTTMTINLRQKLIRLHSMRRRRRIVGLLKEAVARFSKSDVDDIRINRELNNFLERNANGASFMWAKLKVNVEKTEGKVEVKLYAQKTEKPTTAAAPKAAPGSKTSPGVAIVAPTTAPKTIPTPKTPTASPAPNAAPKTAEKPQKAEKKEEPKKQA